MPRVVPEQKDRRYWDPMFPGFAEGADTPLSAADDTGAVPWTPAPADSHLDSFRYYDAREHRWMRRVGDGRSQLHVRFKPSGKAGMTEYWYYFADAAEGAAVFERMAAAESPGEVVHADLIRKAVPYHRNV